MTCCRVLCCLQVPFGVCLSFCSIDSTTHQIIAGSPVPSRRVINNWPFVPFLPCLFLFSPPLLLLSPSSSPPSLSHFSLSTSCHPSLFISTSLFPALSIIHSIPFSCPLCSLPLFSDTPLFFLILSFRHPLSPRLFISVFSHSGHSGDLSSYFY